MSDPCACALIPCTVGRDATAATSAKHAHIHCCLADAPCHSLEFPAAHLNSGCGRPHQALRAWLDHERLREGTHRAELEW